MTAELTEELAVEAHRALTNGEQVSTWLLDALCDAALRDVRARGQKPVAWMVWSPMSGPAQFSTDPRTPVVAASRADYICDALYTTPQPTKRDGLLAAAKVCDKYGLGDPWCASHRIAKELRALADKEPT